MADKLKEFKGAFVGSLLRNSAKIREDRAVMIYRGAEKNYRRKIEDLESETENMETEREGQLDMSPTDINSLVLASEFKADKFFEVDTRLTLAIRENRIRLEEYIKRYEYLFGPYRRQTTPTVEDSVMN